jgi:two-component system cell cycle sensor histidine kinase/response regulator CckA
MNADDNRAANERLRMVVQSMPVMMDAFDENRLITVWNSECERVTGFSADEVIGNPDALLLMYPDAEYRERMLREWTVRGNNFRNWAWEMTCKDGSKRTIEWSDVSGALPIPGWTTWGIGIDVTERLRLEAAMRQSQKMDAIGQLAAGVAHDFNNLLTVMTGCVADILAEMEAHSPGSPTETAALLLSDTIERATKLTRQLLLFSRQVPPRLETLDLNAVAASCERVLARTLGDRVALRLNLRGGLDAVRGDVTQIEQVIFNLCINARDAMPDGGTVVVRTDSADVSAADLSGWPNSVPGRYLTLSVTDSGVGMTEDITAHIFEPFFTTKPVGRGTGLGLSTVLTIVHGMSGFINIESRPGAGTTMTVYLPAAPAIE